MASIYVKLSYLSPLTLILTCCWSLELNLQSIWRRNNKLLSKFWKSRRARLLNLASTNLSIVSTWRLPSCLNVTTKTSSKWKPQTSMELLRGSSYLVTKTQISWQIIVVHHRKHKRWVSLIYSSCSNCLTMNISKFRLLRRTDSTLIATVLSLVSLKTSTTLKFKLSRDSIQSAITSCI